MATKTIEIPQSFITSMNQFMGTMQRFQLLTKQFNLAAGHIQPPRFSIAHSTLVSRFRRFSQVLSKIETMLRRSIDAIVNAMGTIAKGFLRALAFATEALGPIIGFIGATGVAIGSITVTAFLAGSRLMKWIWDKLVGLGDSMLQDWLASSGSLSSMGGLRAYRLAFAGLPQDPAMLSNMAQGRGQSMSPQAQALRNLGVLRFKDSADMMVQATLAASRYLKAQRKGTEIVMAQAMALDALFSPEQLIAMREIDEEELRTAEKFYNDHKAQLQLTDKAKHGWINFSLTVQKMWIGIQSTIAERLADPNSNFVKALDSLSQSIVKFLKVFINSPAFDMIVKKVAEWIERFGKWLSGGEGEKAFRSVWQHAKNIAKLILEIIEQLKKLKEIFIPTTKAPTRFMGRRGLAQRIGMERPVGAPRAVPGRPITRYPGRERFTKKIGIARPPGAPQISPEAPIDRFPGRKRFAEKIGIARPPAAPRIAPRIAPKAKAPDGSSGTTGSSTNLKDDRARYAEELKNNPALRDKILRIAANEQGKNPQGTQAVIESMMNRASVRGTTLEQQARWHKAEKGGYYEMGNMGRGALENVEHRKVLEQSLSNALGGGNLSNYATDNASQGLAARERASGAFKYRKDYTGETFFSPGTAEPRLAQKWEEWHGRVSSGTSDSAGSSNAPTIQQAPTPGEKRLTTVGNYRLGGDPRRAKLLQAGEEASKNLPPGWRVEAYSGQRDGANQGPHAHSGAIDFRLIRPDGTMVSNYQNPENFAVYERFAQDSHLALQKIDPTLAAQHRWGGYFSGDFPHYGAMDLMHQDYAGGNDRMAAGKWETGVDPGWKRRWGVGESSRGIGARQQELNASTPSTPTTAPDSFKFGPSQTGRGGPQAHPINKVKVDNRSDEDVSSAKTDSDNDDHGGHHAPEGTETMLPPVTGEEE